MKRAAVYAGSFDPITYGHLDIIQQASKLFYKLYVAIGTNTSKTPLFTVQQRSEQLQEALADQGKCSIEICSFPGLLVDFAKATDARFIVRGLRDHIDFGYESQLARGNADLCPDIQTVWFYSRPEYQHVSSSFVRELMKLGADVSKYTPVNGRT